MSINNITIFNSELNKYFDIRVNEDFTVEYDDLNYKLYGKILCWDMDRFIILWKHTENPTIAVYKNLNNIFVKIKIGTKNSFLPEDFDPAIYQLLNSDLNHMNLEELEEHYINRGVIEARQYKFIINPNINSYIPKETNSSKPKTQVKVIAYYFPQYHVIPENERWWGEGFTDWDNVKKTKPLIDGHYQPHIPDDYIGYYDLVKTPDIQNKQIELAKEYGVYGFCFYTYWFGGKKILEKPLEQYLKNNNLDLPFCICWANENWTRRWDGLDNEVLIAQKYSPTDDIEFIKYVSSYLKDSRYIKINNKPLLMIYRPSAFPDIKATVKRWRKWCKINGVGDIYLVYPQSFDKEDPKKFGFDAASEFPPISSAGAPIGYLNNQYVYDMNLFMNQKYNSLKKTDYKLFKGLCPSWDNTPRRKEKASIFFNSSPTIFQDYAETIFRHTLENYQGDERIVFVNAWNEWAEGCHLEPDKQYGYGWLQAIKNAHNRVSGIDKKLIKKVKRECLILLSKNSKKTKKLKPKEIAVIYHSFYPEYLKETLKYIEKITELNNCKFIITAPLDKLDECRNIINKQINKFEFILLETKNKGKDILPFFKIYDFIINSGIKVFCKIHSKKSPHRTDGDIWRKELMENLLNPRYIQNILYVLSNKNNTGLVLPKKYMYSSLSLDNNSPLTIEKVQQLAKFLDVCVDNESIFPAGSMFWARTEALIPMYKILDLSNETYFPEEFGQTDNTFAHICERLFSISARSIGLKTIPIEEVLNAI